MDILTIKTGASYKVLNELRGLMKDSWNLKSVEVHYNTRHFPSEYDINSYPVTLYFEEYGREIQVKILSLSVGYRGEGPTDFAEILDFLGVTYDEDDIFTKKKIDFTGFINLKFYVS